MPVGIGVAIGVALALSHGAGVSQHQAAQAASRRPCHKWAVVSQAYVESGGRTNVCGRNGRMDVVMSANTITSDNDEVSGAINWCVNSGGELINYPVTWSYKPLRGALVCEDVDH